jgi:hypothetical protein
VDGSTIPLVDFDVGPSWSGLLPISADPNETRKVRVKVLRYTALVGLTASFFSFSSGSSLQAPRVASTTSFSGEISVVSSPKYPNVLMCLGNTGRTGVLDAHHWKAFCKKTE